MCVYRFEDQFGESGFLRKRRQLRHGMGVPSEFCDIVIVIIIVVVVVV